MQNHNPNYMCLKANLISGKFKTKEKIMHWQKKNNNQKTHLLNTAQKN